MNYICTPFSRSIRHVKGFVNQIFKTFDSKNVSHLIVTNDQDEISGVISKQDLLSKINSISRESSGKIYTKLKMTDIKAKDIMTENPISVRRDDALEYAVELLLQKKFHCLPVLESNKTIGIVTAFDLLKGYYQEYG